MKNKKNYFKQILSVMLVVCMMAAFVPAAFANTEETATGVKVVYDFNGCTKDVLFDNTVTYANSVSNGRFAFGATNETAANRTTKFSVSTTYTQIAASVPFLSINLNKGNYWAMKIRMPKNKTYNVAVNYVHIDNRNNTTMNARIWILPAATTNIANAIKTDSTSLVTIDGTKQLETSATVLDTENGTFQSGEGEEYFLVFKRPDDQVSSGLRLFSVELSEINTSTGTVYENLEIVPFYGKVSATSPSLTDDDDKSATLSVSDVYMSDGKAAPEGTDLSGVEYVSSNDSVITIIDGDTAYGTGEGKATISAYLNGVCLGSVDMTSSVTPKTGVYIKYDFAGYEKGVTLQDVDYNDGNSHGRMEFYANSEGDTAIDTINDTTYQGIVGSVKFGQIGINEMGRYFAFKVRMPKKKKYDVAVNYVHYNARNNVDSEVIGQNMQTDVYILPADTVDIATSTWNSGNKKPSVLYIDGAKVTDERNKYATMEKVTGTFEAGNEEEYLLVFARTGNKGSNGLRLVSIELSEIDPETGKPCANPVPVPLYSEGTIGESILTDADEKTTVGISTVYMSDGTAAPESTDLSGVTYVSSDNTVATVSETTVTATGAGRATIYPVYNGVSLGAHGVGGADVEVSAVNEDGNPTASTDKSTVTPSVFTLTTVLGKAYSTSETENVTENIDQNGYITVTADEEDAEGNVFLYWAKGLVEGVGKKVFLPDENNPYSCTFKPAVGSNYLIAVYGKKDAEYEDKYFNANGQLLDSTNGVPDLPSMPGYGTAKGFVNCGFGRFIAEYDPANEASYRIIVNNNTTEEIRYVKYGTEVTVTAEDSSEGDNFRFWKKRAKGGEYEIVSFDKDYTFYAFENCEVTAVYTKAEQASAVEAFRKIILTNIGGTQFMTEFIGFDDAVEKGIAIGGQRIAMTTDATQFTLDAETTEGVKGYAIDGDGNVYYAD